MTYNNVWAYRDAIVQYLEEQKELYSEDIEQNKMLSDPEKEEKGLLIRDVTIEGNVESEYKCSYKVNNTKLRPGDKVFLVNEAQQERISAMVIENMSELMYLECSDAPKWKTDYRIEVQEYVMLDPLIQLFEGLEPGMPGVFFLKQLAGLECPDESNLDNNGAISPLLSKKLNEQQLQICQRILREPSIYCVQGPPGTGKTNVLAVTSAALTQKQQNVLVIAKTHQAVNNALEKIAETAPYASIVKIGSIIKAPKAPNVKHFKTLKSYLRYSQKNKTRFGSTVGMTLQSAIINMGLQTTSFCPTLVLVDEASQIQLAEASIIGALGAQSIVFVGDDKQMPPIFHEGQKGNPMSVSIFEYLIKLYTDFEDKLCVTYRMNQELTEFVSKHYYEPYGEKITSSDFSKDNTLLLEGHNEDGRINDVLSTQSSLVNLDVSTSDLWEDYNPEEAAFIANLLKEYVSCGMSPQSVAVITPFRKQVLAIKEAAKQLLVDVPIIDTVERLQGQDVDMIVISMATTSTLYYNTVRGFLLNRKRLNVMLSRARMKAIILCKDFIWSDIIQ